jgi:hypothetical protein
VVVGVRVTADSVCVVVVVAAGSLTTVVQDDRAIALMANKVCIFINQLNVTRIDRGRGFGCIKGTIVSVRPESNGWLDVKLSAPF